MLNAVLKSLNNYFIKYTNGSANYSYTKDVTFTSNNTITAVTASDFADTYIVGEYILIENTRINDGVYLISAITDDAITVDATLDITISTEGEVEATMTKCYIPDELIDLITEIKTYNSSTTEGIASESQGSRSVSYNGQSGWLNAFNSRLSVYKKLRWC